MSAKSFIAELERRKLLSDRLMGKLRESLATQTSPMSAERVAHFLVQKNHLTQQQAHDVLAGLTQSGVDLFEEDVMAPDVGEASSVFTSHIISRGSMPNEVTLSPEDDDEIRLLPLADDASLSDRQISSDEDFPIIEEPELEIEITDDLATSRRDKSAQPRLATIVEEESPSTDFEDFTVGGAPQPPSDDKKDKSRALGLRKKGDKKKLKRTREKKRWDSPLILIGGGALTLLLLVGGTIAFLMNYESGDQKLAQAREALKSGAYAQSIDFYQDFLTTSPRHPEHSLARVQVAMVRIRQLTEGNDFAGALTTTETELKAIEDEPSFETAHDELAALLPQIAAGLAKQAEQAPPTSEDPKKYVTLANKALEMCNNAGYVPKPLRDETKLANVRDALERVERRQQSQLALAESLKEMEQALTDGKPIGAYAAHMKLLKDHPELASEAGLAEALKKAAAAEQAAIRFVAEPKAAETAERPTPWIAALAVANRRATATVPGATDVDCIRIDGAVYGLDAPTGKLLWRRHVGFGSTGWPILIDRDVIFADTVRHELLRLDAATGKLLWRQTIGTPFAEPLLVGDRAYVAADSGRLFVLDLKTGARTGYIQFPQPLRDAPAINRLKTHLYLAGDRASVYSISLADMKCNGVFFLGHAPGTIQVAPVAVVDKLAVVENNGVETSRLHLLSIDDKSAISKQLVERRLNGLVTSSPPATGRGLIVVTDRGQIEVYDIAAGKEGEPLTLVASRNATSSQPLTRHVAIVGRNIWVADTQLTKFNIVPTGNQLPVEEIENNRVGATFDHPLASFGDALIQVYRPKGRAGVVVAAIDTKQGRTFWETELAMPPAGAPVVDDSAKSLTVANATGYAFRFDEAAIRSRVQDQPLATSLGPPQPPVLTASTDLGQGRAIYSAANSEWLLLYNPAQANTAKWIQLASPLACAPTPFGQGFLAPLKVGQVFYLSSSDGSRLATPFQPRLDPQTKIEYRQASSLKPEARQFVISDGGKQIYLVALADQPQPNLQAVKDADVGPYPIGSPVIVLGDTAVAIAGETHLVRFKLPALESTGESNLPAPAEWGPYSVGDAALVATVDQKLLAVTAGPEPRWQVLLEHGPLAGPPLVLGDSVLLAYRKGILERRALADGKPLATLDVEQPLATGPVTFLQKIVVAASDGTLLVVAQP